MRSSILSLASTAILATQISAFKHTSPLLIWSSEPNEAILEAASEITSGVIASEEVYASMSSLGCDWDNLVIVHVDELHNSHLSSRSLPQTRKPDFHLPYLLRPSKSTLDSAVNDWAKICGAEVVDDLKGLSQVDDEKKVVLVDVKGDKDLSSLPIPTQPHLLILTGTHSKSLESNSKRQERPFPSHSSSEEIPSPTGSEEASSSPTPSHNSTIPIHGPILDRIQILTTPVLTGLIITFFIFLPITLFGVSSLVGIQVPPRMMEIGKGMVVNQERKDR